MKKIFSAIAVLTMVFSLVSCGGDDEAKVYAWEGKTWYELKGVSYDCTDAANNREVGFQCNENYCLKYSFNNGQFVMYDIENGVTTEYPGTYTVADGQIVTLVFENADIDTRFELVDEMTLRMHGLGTGTGGCMYYTELKLDSTIN